MDALWLVPTLPLAGFLILTVFGGLLDRNGQAVVGVGSVGASAVAAVVTALAFMIHPPPGHAFDQTLWTWINVGGLQPGVSFYLDSLSVLMMLVVTIVGFLIHLYSSEHLEEEEGYRRFFAYMNLFVSGMLVLVLADNLVLLYLGWETVGLCSYLLIGFWYRDPENGWAARKAFVVTRVGDAAMAIGLFLIFTQLGTLNIQQVLQVAPTQWAQGSTMAVAAAGLLLAGAVGKSAQLPLQTWLPDAMAGPSPVSALIHAATMVTAGVYLIARTNVLFTLAPTVQELVAVIGALTLLISACSAIVQTDIKRVLAYSTISQIGYMFLALGVGAWPAAMFHFMTHAFFKALLFLGAGAIISALDDEHDIFRMGGLRKAMPGVFWTFLVGCGSLAAVPLITAGFYSKDKILWDTWASVQGGPWLWAAGLLGAFLTAIYSFRLVFLVFYGEQKTPVGKQPRFRMMLPLATLGVLSVIGGYIEVPESLGGITVFTDFLHQSLPETMMRVHDTGLEALFESISGIVAILGILIAFWFYLQRPVLSRALARTGPGRMLDRWWFTGWGFDWLYDVLFTQPYVFLSRLNHRDIVDWIYRFIAWICRTLNTVFSATQTGNLRWYAAGIGGGSLFILALVVLL